VVVTNPYLAQFKGHEEDKYIFFFWIAHC